MAYKGWDKIKIHTDKGFVKGIAPIIISASRATDIPAFHAKWFVERLKAGYLKWVNPFNGTAQYVSFANARVIVFWTKNPQPMIHYLPLIDEKNINYYFTFTLNDYEQEGFEPNVPPLLERVATFQKLSAKIGREKVVWRFDPLILTERLDTDRLMDKIYSLAVKLHRFTEKLVISFVDIHNYSKVSRNLQQAGYQCREFSVEDMDKLARGLALMRQEFGLEIATCGERIDLKNYGIVKNKCVDDVLMRKIFKDDTKLMNFLNCEQKEQSLFGEDDQAMDLKDKGQRNACNCIVSKDIGQYNTCLHLCRYCYANNSEKTVKANFSEINDKTSETIIPNYRE